MTFPFSTPLFWLVDPVLPLPLGMGRLLPCVPPGAASPFSTLSPLPSRPPLFQMAPPSVPEGQIGAALNPGPVTGYGPGGLGHVPDSPLNLPY